MSGADHTWLLVTASLRDCLTVGGLDAHNQSEHLANPGALACDVYLPLQLSLFVSCLDSAHPVGLYRWPQFAVGGMGGSRPQCVCLGGLYMSKPKCKNCFIT